jgi:hypothetical protein
MVDFFCNMLEQKKAQSMIIGCWQCESGPLKLSLDFAMVDLPTKK